MRCFSGIEVSESARTAIGLAFGLPRREAGVSWVDPASLHITLWYFGDVEESALAPLGVALGTGLSSRPAFSLKLAGIGQFPPRRQPRVLWLAVEDGANACAACVAAMAGHLQRLGYARDLRPYEPHITVARSRDEDGGRLVSITRKSFAGVAPVEWRVREVILFRSDPFPTGSRHTPLARFPLENTGPN